MVMCNSKCGVFGSNIFGRKCKDVRKQVCEVCGSLAAINPNLEYACSAAVNGANPPRTTDDFLCKKLGGQALFQQYGIEACGFEFTNSVQYKSWDVQNTADEKSQAASKTVISATITLLGMLLTVGFLYLIIPSKK